MKVLMRINGANLNQRELTKLLKSKDTRSLAVLVETQYALKLNFGGNYYKFIEMVEQLKPNVIEEIVRVEQTDYLGYGFYVRKNTEFAETRKLNLAQADRRNGTFKSRVLTSNGVVKVNLPRNRYKGFKSQIFEVYSLGQPKLERDLVDAFFEGMMNGESLTAITAKLNKIEGPKIEITEEITLAIINAVWPLIRDWLKGSFTEVFFASQQVEPIAVAG